MTHRILPSREYLRECYRYEPETGLLYWLLRPRHHFNTAHGRKIANSRCYDKPVPCNRHGSGHMITALNKQTFLYARLVWKFHNDTDPVVLYHINGNLSDNRIENLTDIFPSGRDTG
jgi:hypothetical protein